MENDLVVYDKLNDTVHHLNATVAWVWRLCDGARDLEDVRAAASAELETELPLEAIVEALALLDQAHLLLEASAQGEGDDSRMSRRDLLIRMGITAAAIPVLTTILAPTPAAAATCLPTQQCTRNGSTFPKCPGEDLFGVGNCRCATSGSSTCISCVNNGGTATDKYNCCSGNGTSISGGLVQCTA
jgi:hypothetical protein